MKTGWLRLLLPVPLLALLWLPFGMFTSPFWFGGAAWALVAASRLLRLRAVSPPRTPVGLQHGLVIALFTLAVVNHAQASAAASSRMKEAAHAAQQVCDRQGVCPTAPPGFTLEEGAARPTALVGRVGVLFRLGYTRADDQRSFTVGTSFNMDDAEVYQGGIGKKVTRHRYIDGEDIYARGDDDAP